MPNLGIDSGNLVFGPGDVLYQRRGVTLPTVTAIAAPAPTTTTFSIVDANDMIPDQEKLRVGDVLQLASATPTHTALEASTLPRIISMVSDGTNTLVTVSPAFSVAPPTTAGGVRVLYKMLGATEGDIQINFDIARSKRRVDQSPFVVSSRVQSIDAMIIVPVAELLSSHLALALGIAPGSDETEMSVGDGIDTDREDRILAVVPADDTRDRFVVAQRCVSEGQASLKASSSNGSIIELNLGMMLDTSLGAKGLFDMKTAAA